MGAAVGVDVGLGVGVNVGVGVGVTSVFQSSKDISMTHLQKVGIKNRSDLGSVTTQQTVRFVPVDF